ncbi:hypothetical protein V6N13_144281 [Hibiscus sabdariffa]|uniref:Acyl-[acyl-carrier-protein] hydrolase n=1 Tax=Hibiscus sabdariffa TaxID=183260 RepID=A0ABR1Z5S3_9ROSI
MIKSGVVFQKNVCVRSFEIDPEYRMSTKAIMNYLQETSLEYGKKLGLLVDARFGVTPGMCKLDLVWVFRDMRIEVDRYPCCFAVMMNKKTRKSCKLPEEVKDELRAFVTTDVDLDPVIEAQRYSTPRIETMDHIRTGLTPGWNDLDVNYHVNNAKYLDWVLESTPDWIIYSHELWKINFEYRKECLKDDVIQSLSRVVTDETDGLSVRMVEMEHVLRLASGIQVLRARTGWRPTPRLSTNDPTGPGPGPGPIPT